jgi:hypothetical protein
MGSAAAERLPFSDSLPSWNKKIRTHGASQADEPSASAVRVIEIQTGEAIPRELPNQYKMSKTVFSGKDMKLIARKPVSISLERGERFWLAENSRLDIYATGATTQEAIEEFVAHLLSFYRHYTGLQPSQATGNALMLKQLFEDGFTEASE